MKTTEERLALKKKILEACLQQQATAIENLKKVMDEAADSAEDYGLPKDLYDSYRNQLMSKREMYAQQIQKVNEQVDILRRVEVNRLFETVRFGTVVITDTQRLFVAAGIGKVAVDGMEYFAISPVVPFFSAIDGKKKGDSFDFKGRKMTIVDVF
jgi:hypothetical protein